MLFQTIFALRRSLVVGAALLFPPHLAAAQQFEVSDDAVLTVCFSGADMLKVVLTALDPDFEQAQTGIAELTSDAGPCVSLAGLKIQTEMEVVAQEQIAKSPHYIQAVSFKLSDCSFDPGDRRVCYLALLKNSQNEFVDFATEILATRQDSDSVAWLTELD